MFHFFKKYEFLYGNRPPPLAFFDTNQQVRNSHMAESHSLLRPTGPLRVQAVTRARRVKEERSGNRSVNVGGMTPVVCGPGVVRPRDRVIMIRDHIHELLSADSS